MILSWKSGPFKVTELEYKWKSSTELSDLSGAQGKDRAFEVTRMVYSGKDRVFKETQMVEKW